MKHSLFYVFATLFLLSCGNSEKKKEEQLYREVMEIHDEVMPHMGEVMQLTKELDKNIDQLKSEDSTTNPQPSIEHLTTLKQNLSDADEAMMNWMRKFNTEMDSMSHEEKMHYLQDEKEKIQEVKVQVSTVIQEAKEAIEATD